MLLLFALASPACALLEPRRSLRQQETSTEASPVSVGGDQGLKSLESASNQMGVGNPILVGNAGAANGAGVYAGAGAQTWPAAPSTHPWPSAPTDVVHAWPSAPVVPLTAVKPYYDASTETQGPAAAEGPVGSATNKELAFEENNPTVVRIGSTLFGR